MERHHLAFFTIAKRTIGALMVTFRIDEELKEVES